MSFVDSKLFFIGGRRVRIFCDQQIKEAVFDRSGGVVGLGAKSSVKIKLNHGEFSASLGKKFKGILVVELLSEKKGYIFFNWSEVYGFDKSNVVSVEKSFNGMAYVRFSNGEDVIPGHRIHSEKFDLCILRSDNPEWIYYKQFLVATYLKYAAFLPAFRALTISTTLIIGIVKSTLISLEKRIK